MPKKAFALRIDEKTLSALQHWADDEFRSINGQIEYLLHQALQKAGRLPIAAAQKDNQADSKPANISKPVPK